MSEKRNVKNRDTRKQGNDFSIQNVKFCFSLLLKRYCFCGTFFSFSMGQSLKMKGNFVESAGQSKELN